MIEIRANKRTGVTLIELLVVIAVVGVLAALVVAAVQKVRGAAGRAETVNNLRQIGLAMQQYQNRCGAFPTEGNAQAPSLYQSILPNLEQSTIGAQPTGVRLFLCTARRGTEVGAKRDFGYASSLALDSMGPSILDSGPVRLADITRGAANVYLLTCLWMDPRTYSGGDPTDIGWQKKFNSRMYGGAVFPDSDPAGSDVYLGGPFADSLPHLYADGHVAELSYAGYTNQWSYVFGGNCAAALAAAASGEGTNATSNGTSGTIPENPLMPNSGSALQGYSFSVTPNAAADAAAINEAINQVYKGGPDMSDHAASAKYQGLLSNPTPDNVAAALNMLKQGGLCSLDSGNAKIMNQLNQALNDYRTNPNPQSTANLVSQLSQMTPFDAGNGQYVWIDPEIATGYDYATSGNNFRSVLLPKPLPRGQKTFELVVDGKTFPLEAGKPFDFVKRVSAGGVAAFTIRGIDAAEKLDPANPTAFVTGLTFMNGAPVDIQMIPRTVRKGLPTWTWFLFAVALSLIGVMAVWRRRKQGTSAAAW